MSTNTTYYNLVKPDYVDSADIAVLNSNMDIIDAQMKLTADALVASSLPEAWIDISANLNTAAGAFQAGIGVIKYRFSQNKKLVEFYVSGIQLNAALTPAASGNITTLSVCNGLPIPGMPNVQVLGNWAITGGLLGRVTSAGALLIDSATSGSTTIGTTNGIDFSGMYQV